MNRSSSERGGRRTAARRPAAQEPADRPASLEPIIERLATFGEIDGWIVSCYLKLEPRDRSRGKYQIKLKNRIKRALVAFEQRQPDRGPRAAVERDLERVREYLEHPGNLPTGRGIAIFACEAVELFTAIPLALVFRSRLAIARSPLVRELAALNDEFGRVVCAVSDRTTARFFEVSAGDAIELHGLAAGETTRASRFRASGESRGRGLGASAHGEHNFNQRIREEKHRHYAQVAQRLFTLSRRPGVVGIVLAGTGADVSAVEPHLHPYSRDALLGTTKLNPKSATPSDVMDAVLAVRLAKEREWEARHVEELQDGVGNRWALNGIGATLDALARGQVRTLMVDPTVERAGFRCRASGRLALAAEECTGQGAPEPVADLIDEAIEEALRQGSHIEVIEDPELRSHVSGLGALLRFKVA